MGAFSLRGLAVGLLVGVFPLTLLGQDQRVVIEQGATTEIQIQLESKLQQGWPTLLEKIQNTAKHLRQGEQKEAKTNVKKILVQVESIRDLLKETEEFKEILIGFDEMEAALQEALLLNLEDQRRTALIKMSQAYHWAKTVSANPFLKMIATKLSLKLASDQVRAKDYPEASILLEQAIESLEEIQENPKFDTPEIHRLKNDIVLLHHQVILGRLADEKKARSLYNKASFATHQHLFRFYDLWSRTEVPWSRY